MHEARWRGREKERRKEGGREGGREGGLLKVKGGIYVRRDRRRREVLCLWSAAVDLFVRTCATASLQSTIRPPIAAAAAAAAADDDDDDDVDDDDVDEVDHVPKC